MLPRMVPVKSALLSSGMSRSERGFHGGLLLLRRIPDQGIIKIMLQDRVEALIAADTRIAVEVGIQMAALPWSTRILDMVILI